MIDSKYRTPYQTFLIEPLLRLEFIQKLSPIILTFCGLFFGMLIPLFLFLKNPIPAFCALLLSGFFDTLDGSVARFQNRTSSVGAVLDITFDRIVECAIVLGLFFYGDSSRATLCLFMLSSILICVTTFLVVGIFSENESEKGFHYSPGLIERAEAFIFFGAMILFPNSFIQLGAVFSSLVFLTAVLRVFEFISQNQLKTAVPPDTAKCNFDVQKK